MKKRDRLHLRLSAGDGALLRAAARLSDTSVSEFVRHAAVEAALSAMRNGTAAAEGSQVRAT